MGESEKGMSMRAAFTTEFIYDGVEGYDKRRVELCSILQVEPNTKGGNMIGQIAGITSGLDLAEQDITTWIEEMRWELSKITKVPFKICWLLEGGDIIIKEVPVLDKNEDL